MENPTRTQSSHWKVTASVLGSLCLLLGTIVWLAVRSDSSVEVEPVLPTTHPVFGAIFETMGVFGEPMRVPNASSFRPMSPMTIGSHPMDWMKEVIDGEAAGFLYLWDPVSNSSNVWSVAHCTKTNLGLVTKKDVQAVFCSAADAGKGRTEFGDRWISSAGSGTAILVREGDVILAKHVSRPTAVFVLEMTKQYQTSIRVRYVEVLE